MPCAMTGCREVDALTTLTIRVRRPDPDDPSVLRPDTQIVTVCPAHAALITEGRSLPDRIVFR